MVGVKSTKNIHSSINYSKNVTNTNFQGVIFTFIQAQALVPASTNFVGTKFTIAGVGSGVVSGCDQRLMTRIGIKDQRSTPGLVRCLFRVRLL